MPPDPHEIDALVAKARTGNTQAFDNVVMALQGEVRQFACARVSSADVVEEVVQATFVTAFHKLDSYEPRACFLPWLIGIAANHVRSELRRRLRLRPADDETLEALLLRVRLAQDAQPEAGHAYADGLQACLERLQPRARALLHSRYGEERSLSALAQQFKQPVGALAVTLHRLRATLRRCLEAGRASA